MVFRHEHASQEGPSTTIKWHARQLGLAFSKDGIKWDVDPNPLQLMVPFPPYSPRPAYDPRLTVIDGQPHMCFAVDSPHGTLGGIARTDDFRNFEVICLTTTEKMRLPVIQAAAAAGKPVYTEKPLARGMDEVYAIQKIVRESGIPFCVGHNRRASPAMIAAHSIFRAHMRHPVQCPWRFWLCEGALRADGERGVCRH
jgi:predicted GH43/DUF377 family glycosyl hydrolase